MSQSPTHKAQSDHDKVHLARPSLLQIQQDKEQEGILRVDGENHDLGVAEPYPIEP